jgi:hypothetical protein
MTDAPTLTLTSFLHGERQWLRIGEREHTRRDGRPTVLAVWRSKCVICDEAFEVATPRGVKAVEQSKRFEMTTCCAHRMTPSETAKLRFAKRDQRRAVFEALKRHKLETPIAPSVVADRPQQKSPVRASPPTSYQLSTAAGRERAERITQFVVEHREQAAKELASDMMKARDEAEADDALAERLASYWRPKPQLPN